LCKYANRRLFRFCVISTRVTGSSTTVSIAVLIQCTFLKFSILLPNGVLDLDFLLLMLWCFKLHWNPSLYIKDWWYFLSSFL
jgi:hypothetical protein